MRDQRWGWHYNVFPAETPAIVFWSTYRVAIEVAEYIRSLGYPAQAFTSLAPDSSVEVLGVAE